MTPARETTFGEVMAGPARLATGERVPLRLDLAVTSPGVLTLWGDTTAELTGRVTLPGLVDDPAATGTLEIAPLRRRRLRYRLTMRALDGRVLRLDGWKSIRLLRPVHTMTTLPATLYDADDTVLGEAVLRFDLRTLPRFLASFRLRRRPAPVTAGDGLWSSRWRGQAGRLEVWYATLTDPGSGTGAWLHQEIVAPADGATPYQHGWVAAFPPGEEPLVRRVGRTPVAPARDGDPLAPTWRPDALAGASGDAAWELTARGAGPALHTFPLWSWRRELLPAAHLVATPGARYDGTIRIGGREFTFAGAPGAASRIHGHGNAQRWAWLHADLDDDTVLEIVTAVSTRPLLRRLPPLTFLRLRTREGDWPARASLFAAARLHSTIGLPTWAVSGRVGGRRIHVRVDMDPAATVTLDYAEPHGDRVVCRNSERADVTVEVQDRSGAVRRWALAGTAHAEVGGRE